MLSAYHCLRMMRQVKAGDDVDIQVKDIGKWIAGEAVAVGDELTTRCRGKGSKGGGRKLYYSELPLVQQQKQVAW